MRPTSQHTNAAYIRCPAVRHKCHLSYSETANLQIPMLLLRSVLLGDYGYYELGLPAARLTKCLTIILRLSYDNAKVTIDLRRTCNLQNVLHDEREAFLRHHLLARPSETVFVIDCDYSDRYLSTF